MNIRNWPSVRKEMGKECGRALPHHLPVSRSSLSLLCCNSETGKCLLKRLFQATRRLSSPQRPEYVLKEAHLRHPIHKAGSSLGTQAQVQSIYFEVYVYSLSLGMSPCLHAK